MSLLERVITAHRCRSTHHYIAIDALSQIQGPDAEKWKNLLLLHNHELLEGAKAPDAKFKDFKNHVLHISEGEWGGARDKAMEWYGQAVEHLQKKQWSKAAYALGVMSHYYADPIQPFHTGQTEEEGSIHRALEWSVAKSRDVIKERIEEKGYPSVSAGDGPGFVSEMVRAGAEESHPHYQTLLDHYDIDAGVKNPPAGLDQTLIDIFAELIAYATSGLGVLYSRAFKEAGVAAPKVHISVPGYIATLDIPLRWVTSKIDDVNDRHTVEAMYKELQKTGKVIKTLPNDDKAIRKLHAKQVLRKPMKVLDAQELRQTGTKHVARDGFEQVVKADRAVAKSSEPSKKELRAQAKADAAEAKRAAAEAKQTEKAQAKAGKAEAKKPDTKKTAPVAEVAGAAAAVAAVAVKETRADKKAKAKAERDAQLAAKEAEKEVAKAAKAEAEASKRAEKKAQAETKRAEKEAAEAAKLAEREAAEAAKQAEMEAAVKAKEAAVTEESKAKATEAKKAEEDAAAEEARKRVADAQAAKLKAAEEADRLAQEEIAREEEARLEAEEEERIAQEDERMVAAEAARRKLEEEEAARIATDEAERRANMEADRLAAEATESASSENDEFEVDEAYYEDEEEGGEPEFSLEELAAFETNLTDNGDLPDDDEAIEAPDAVEAIEAPRAAPPVESFFENGPPNGGSRGKGLSIDDPVVDAPSIGKKTAKRLSKLGIETIGDLLECDIEETAFELDVRHIDEQTLIDWQDQSMLMIDVPGLRVHDAQILVGSGIRSADDLSNASAEKVFRTAMGFLSTPDGARVVRDDHVLDQNEVDDWIGMAREAKSA